MPKGKIALDFGLPTPRDLPALHQNIRHLSREILSMMRQPGYLPLVRMIIAEASRFPQLGTLFFSTVTQRGLALFASLLREAREQEIIADVNIDAVAQTWLGGLLTAVIMSLVLGEQAHPLTLDHADAVVEPFARVALMSSTSA